MSFKRKVAYNLIIQAVGPGLAFFTIFLLARFYGPSVQGSFAKFKAFVDLIITIGTFGFPQGFVYLINRLKVSPRLLAIRSVIYSAGYILLALVLIDVFIFIGYIDKGFLNENLIYTLLLSVVCSILVLQQMWRGVYLVYDAGQKFALFSILPAAFLFFAVLICVFSSSFSPINAYLLSAAPVLVIATIMILPVIKQNDSAYVTVIPWRELWRHGIHASLQSLAVILQPIIAYWLIKKYIGGEQNIGFFNIGLFFIQGFVVPIGMVSPLLFEKWTKSEDISEILKKFKSFTGKLLIADAILGLCLAGAVAIIIPLLFSKQYQSSILLSQILLFTVPLMFHGRIVLPAIHANGFPNLNTHSGFIRVVSFLTVALIFILFSKLDLVKLAISWSIAEIFASAYTLICLHVIIKDKTILT